ncbi:MAG: hypothetical protein ACP6IS_10935 [Candidatus Asgardarchaeia archaeon]
MMEDNDYFSARRKIVNIFLVGLLVDIAVIIIMIPIFLIGYKSYLELFFILVPNTKEITLYWSLVIANLIFAVVGILIASNAIFKNFSLWTKFMMVYYCSVMTFVIFMLNIMMPFVGIWTPAGSGFHVISVLIGVGESVVMGLRVLQELAK